jgi:hypothetical protein
MTTIELQKQLSSSMEAFNQNRFQLLSNAFQSGSEDDVDKLLTEYDALRDAYYTLLRQQLDDNNPRYVQLLEQTNHEALSLENAIKTMGNITDITKFMDSTVNLVGRIVMILGVV